MDEQFHETFFCRKNLQKQTFDQNWQEVVYWTVWDHTMIEEHDPEFFDNQLTNDELLHANADIANTNSFDSDGQHLSGT